MKTFIGKHFVIGHLKINNIGLINTLKGFNNPFSFIFRNNGFLMFYITHIGIVTDADNQDITHSLATFQQIQVSHMKQVEHTYRIAYFILFHNKP